MNIIQDLIPKGRKNRPGRANPMKYITIHNTGNTSKGADARNHAAYIKGDAAANAPVSWHYTTDEKYVIQHIPDNEDAFHAGDGGGNGNRQSIGIEICMNSDGSLTAATDKAAELAAFLCKKYNIPVENIKQHNNWSGKNCPQLIRSGKPYSWDVFISKVRAFMGATAPPSVPATPSTPSAPTAANDKTIWDFFKGKKLNDYAVAGIMGNLFAESGLKPTNLQNGFETRLNMTDEAYTQGVDSGTYTNFVRDCAGYGLAQWTYWSRKEALLLFACSAGASIGDLHMQLNFMWTELQGYKGVIDAIQNAKTVLEASNVILLQYEKPADQSEAAQKKRAEYGQGYFNKFAKVTVPTVQGKILYRVQVGAFAVKKNADTLVTRLKAHGHETLVVEDGSLFRIQVGAFAERKNAEALAATLKGQGFDTHITTFGG